MADAVGARHVQGAFEEGQPASNERPVLVAGKDASGNVKVLVLDSSGHIQTKGS